MNMPRALFAAATLAALTSCGVDADKIADHKLYADDEDTLTHEGESLQFAVVGNLRPPIPGVDQAGRKGPTDGVSQAIVADMRKRVDRQELDFVLLMGDSVRWGSTKEWGTFDGLFQEVLDGETIPNTEGYRVPVLPVAGDRDYAGDKALMGMEGAFPGYGVDIGFNRVASWLSFDVRVEDTVWRMLVLDSNHKDMGSRWNEQMYWIPRATEGRFDNMILFMHDPLLTLTEGTEMDAEGAPNELLQAVEDNGGFLKVRGVFSAEPHSTEVILPDGPLGTAFFTAGGGGAPGETQSRWGNAVDLGYGDIQLETRFDLALQGAFEKEAVRSSIPEDVLDHAKAKGEWEGFTGAYDAKYFSLYGYWLVEIKGEVLEATYRILLPDGTMQDLYTISYTGESWRPL
jgi:hypothetical protein